MEKSKAIKRRLWLLRDFIEAQVVSFYLSMEDEVQTGEMVSEALAMKKRVVVPYIDAAKSRLTLTELREPGKELAPGPYTILQPGEKYLRPVPLSRVELIVVPGLAFDHQGRRLGFGKGFYDRLLARKSSSTTCVGLAFQFQILEEIPARGGDVPMDIVITEEKLIGGRVEKGCMRSGPEEETGAGPQEEN